MPTAVHEEVTMQFVLLLNDYLRDSFPKIYKNAQFIFGGSKSINFLI